MTPERPDDEIARIATIEVIVYLDEDGVECVNWRIDGALGAYKAIGALEWVKQLMFRQAWSDAD